MCTHNLCNSSNLQNATMASSFALFLFQGSPCCHHASGWCMRSAKCPTAESMLPRPQKPYSLPTPNSQTRQEIKVAGRHLFEALSFETKFKIYESIRYDSGGYFRLAGLDAELLCWEGTISTENSRALTHSIKQLSKNSWCPSSKMK